MELHVDADFCGLWNVEHTEYLISVCSITGMIVTLA